MLKSMLSPKTDGDQVIIDIAITDSFLDERDVVYPIIIGGDMINAFLN